MPQEFKNTFVLFEKGKTYVIGITVFLIIFMIFVLSFGGGLASLKQKNALLEGDLKKIKDNLETMREVEIRMAYLNAELNNLKSSQTELKEQKLSQPVIIAAQQPAEGPSKAENNSLNEENRKLREAYAKLRGKYLALVEKNKKHNDEILQLKAENTDKEHTKFENEALLSENRRLVEENSSLKEQVNMLQVSLLRVFKESQVVEALDAGDKKL